MSNSILDNRHELFQSVGTAIALIISILALLVSLYEANLLRSQQRATVWPYLKVSSSFSGKGYSVIAVNNGIGPARIRSLEVRYRGEPVESFMDLLGRIKPDHVIGYGRLRFSSLNNTVLRAGEERVIFNMPWDEETREMAKSMQYMTVRANYCSVMEDCWIFDSTQKDVLPGTFDADLEFAE